MILLVGFLCLVVGTVIGFMLCGLLTVNDKEG